MRKTFMEMFIVVLCFVFTLSCTSFVIAQEAATEEFTLEEITVTAQKREENQQKVPIAMEVVSGDEMRELGRNNLDDIISSISGVYVNTAGDGMRVSIRGVSDTSQTRGSLGTMSNSMPSVAVNTDGIYTASRSSGSNLYDIERMEVLFGPQSTLYASNSPGGIVNIVTGSPKTDIYETYGSLEYGNYNSLKTEGMINVPINEGLALRAAFVTSVRDGYMANGSDDDDTKSARLKALLKPTDKLSFTLTGLFTINAGAGYSGIDMFVDQDDVSDPWDNSYEDAADTRTKHTKEISANIEWDLGLGALTIIPSYSKMAETAYLTVSGVDSYMNNRRTEKGAEARIASSEDFYFKWIVGANIYRMEQAVREETVGTEYYSTSDNSIESQAVFGNITYPLSDTFRITGGLRYSDDENIGVFDTVGEGFSVYRPSTVVYDGLDHKIGVEYDMNTNTMIYADWSTGYRCESMGGAETPETLKAYTLGSKNRFFNNKLQLNMVGYYYDYKDKPASIRMYDPITMRQDANASNVSGDMEMYGADIQADWIISNADKLNVSVSYEHAEYGYLFFDFASPYLEDMDYTGRELTFTPDWTINVAYSHNFILPNGGSLSARIDSRYQTSFRILWNDEYAEAAGREGPIYYYSYAGYNEQEAYHLSNLNITYAHPDGKWTLGGYIKNLENYAVKKNLMQSTMMIGSPRTYGAVLTLKY